jgi:hypothetical protein
MQGSLLERGVGWYLEFEETTTELDLSHVNPGHAIGFGLGMWYVANPIDIIPDMIPIIGFMDDALVIKSTTLAGGAVWDMVFN